MLRLVLTWLAAVPSAARVVRSSLAGTSARDLTGRALVPQPPSHTPPAPHRQVKKEKSLDEAQDEMEKKLLLGLKQGRAPHLL